MYYAIIFLEIEHSWSTTSQQNWMPSSNDKICEEAAFECWVTESTARAESLETLHLHVMKTTVWVVEYRISWIIFHYWKFFVFTPKVNTQIKDLSCLLSFKKPLESTSQNSHPNSKKTSNVSQTLGRKTPPSCLLLNDYLHTPPKTTGKLVPLFSCILSQGSWNTAAPR